MNQVTSHHSVANAAPPSSAALTEFAAQYREVYRRLTLVAAGMVGDRVFAEDLVQEAAVIGLQKFHRFEPNTNFGAWMAEIVRRCSLNYVRKVRNRATYATDPHELEYPDEAPSHAATSELYRSQPGSLEDRGHFDDDVLAALQALDEIPRCCVLLRIVERVSYREIAELLGIPQGTAMSHVHRGKARMRKVLVERRRIR